ncbi:unnamed protein product [Didymodactylos carnosus]|uniref:OTU domain-containing protein n=1 Tax=Didymodactylos carnosus TaxID=1234261 RepID=A0A813UTA7_9BILA|nr:unnamed protein product [Didymodactylos carnosus]CAF3614969.1 unnamed protein product [Didymodactylos carnosus]
MVSDIINKCALCSDTNNSNDSLCDQCNTLTRNQFFRLCLNKLNQAKGQTSLIKDVCQTLLPSFDKFNLDFQPLQYFINDVHVLDTDAQQYLLYCHDNDDERGPLLFSHVRHRLLCVYVTGNGNCFYNAVALIAGKHHDFVYELRVHCLIELAVNAEFYMTHYNWLQLRDKEDTSLLNYLANEMINDKCWADAWDIFALSAVLNCNLRIVFPFVNGENDPQATLMNRVFYPRSLNDTPTNDTIRLLWSNCTLRVEDLEDTFWTPNHFVPILQSVSNIATTSTMFLSRKSSLADETEEMEADSEKGVDSDIEDISAQIDTRTEDSFDEINIMLPKVTKLLKKTKVAKCKDAAKATKSYLSTTTASCHLRRSKRNIGITVNYSENTMLSDVAEEQKVPDSSVKTRSALLKHESDTGHSIDWTSWRILAKDSSSYHLLIRESLAILDKQPELTRTVCSVY